MDEKKYLVKINSCNSSIFEGPKCLVRPPVEFTCTESELKLVKSRILMMCVTDYEIKEIEN